MLPGRDRGPLFRRCLGGREHAHYLRERPDWHDQPYALDLRGALTMDFALLGELSLTGALVGAMYGLVALGIVLIYKTSGTANFAQGAIAMMGAYVTWVFAAGIGLPMWGAIVAAVIVMFGFGMLIERTVLRRMIGQPVIMVVMLTFGIELFLRGAVPGLLGSAVKRLSLGVPQAPVFLGDILINRAYLIGGGIFAAVILAANP